MSTVCVVGGGIAGLAAAHRLTATSAEVVLVERDRLGGKIRTSRFAGRPVDEAADAFLVRVPWAMDLATELGLADHLVSPAARNAFVYVDGQLRPLPTSTVLGVPTDVDDPALAAVLSADGLAVLRADLADPGPPPDGDEAIGPFIRRRLGDEALDRLVGPLVGGINAGDVERLSLEAVVPQLAAAAHDPGEPSLIRACAALRARALGAAGADLGPDQPPVFATPNDGMGSLVDALSAELALRGVAVRLGAAVERIQPCAGGGWTLTTSADATIDVDAIVLAVPPAASGDLLADVAPGMGSFLGGIEQASVAIVTLAIDPADVAARGTTPLDGSGFLVPRDAGLLVTACSWSSSKWAHLAPEAGDSTVLLRASVGRAGDRRFTELDDEALTEAVVADLQRTMGLGGGPAQVRISRWPRSFPQYAPGHLVRLTAVEAELAGDAPTIGVAGAALRGVGIPACIASGQAAADRVLAALHDR